VKKFGKLDILVNNAAFQQHQESIEDLSEEQWERTFRTNIFGYFFNGAARLHLWNGSFRHEEVAEDIGAEGALPLLFGEILDALLMLLEGGVVDQNVELPEFLHRVLHGLAAELRVGNISGDQQTLAVFFLNCSPGFTGVL